jgi:hypothetical protein
MLFYRCVVWQRAFAQRGPHRIHSFPSIVAVFYRAVAQQRVDQIRYNNNPANYYYLSSSLSSSSLFPSLTSPLFIRLLCPDIHNGKLSA